MGLLQDKRFWVGLFVGVAAYYLYSNHVKGKGKGFGQ